MNLPVLLLRIFPLLVVSVMGSSMHPTYKENQRLIVLNIIFVKLHIKDVIVFYEPIRKRILVKRVTKMQQNKFFVEGDNPNKSTDSNQFGWVDKKNVLAKVIYPKTRYNSKQ